MVDHSLEPGKYKIKERVKTIKNPDMAKKAEENMLDYATNNKNRNDNNGNKNE